MFVLLISIIMFTKSTWNGNINIFLATYTFHVDLKISGVRRFLAKWNSLMIQIQQSSSRNLGTVILFLYYCVYRYIMKYVIVCYISYIFLILYCQKFAMNICTQNFLILMIFNNKSNKEIHLTTIVLEFSCRKVK